MNTDDERFIVSHGIDEWFLNFSDIENQYCNECSHMDIHSNNCAMYIHYSPERPITLSSR